MCADISEPNSREPSPSSLRIKGRRAQAIVLSDSEGDQRVPDTVEKATPRREAVDLTSDAAPRSHDRTAAAVLRLSQGRACIPWACPLAPDIPDIHNAFISEQCSPDVKFIAKRDRPALV